MGAPKQKWTQEEELALKAGVRKHGAGKWRTILKDPQFSGILFLRSNVDLKDKWRNMSVMANGWGSREKARLALKRMKPGYKQDDNSLALATVASDEDFCDTNPLAVSSSSSQIAVPNKEVIRLDNLIIEAINTLKEPAGSSKTTIASYIEIEKSALSLESDMELTEKYWSPPNFERLMSAKLKFLTSSGKLIKAKHRYSILPPLGIIERRTPSILLLEDKPKAAPKVENGDIIIPTKAQVDLELAKMRNMTPKEAARAAAEAVAEAEAAIREAEEAVREAEAAEADADAAQAFAEAATKTIRGRNRPETNMQMIRA